MVNFTHLGTSEKSSRPRTSLQSCGPAKIEFSFGCAEGVQFFLNPLRERRARRYPRAMHVVILEIPIKEGLMGEFCAFLKGPYGLHLTRGSVGCRTLRCSIKDDTMVFYEEWLTEKDQQAYMAMRNAPGHAGFEKGVFVASRYARIPVTHCDALRPLHQALPTSVRSSSQGHRPRSTSRSTSRSSEREKVRA